MLDMTAVLAYNTSMTKQNIGDLGSVAASIRALGEERQAKREAFNAKLGEPVLWIPDPDCPTHGVGWFRGDIGFFSYRKTDNGYDENTRTQLEDSLLKALIPHLPPMMLRSWL